MNIKAVGFFLGRVLFLESLCMVPAAMICFVRGDLNDGLAFLEVIGVLAVAGLALSLFKKTADGGMRSKEIFLSVVLGWVFLSLGGSLPFILSGAIPRLSDAFFETASGFTTTGSSILVEVEALSYGMLYWRSFTAWIGGMGAFVFMLAIIPMTKKTGGGLYMMCAESPGPASKPALNMRSAARILYLIYTALTVILIIMLSAGGMPLFDSITHAFSTAGTGGFSIKNSSIGYYDSFTHGYYLQRVISVFMVLFGVNFSVIYLVLIRDIKSVFKSEELRLYLLIIAASTGVIAINVLDFFSNNFRDALHHSFFTVSSIISTTGFSTVDFDMWPELSKTIILFLMSAGACAGSAGGGMKMSRVLILWKSLKHEAQKIIRPHSKRVIKLDDKVLDNSVISAVNGYFALYAIFFIISLLVISADSPGLMTSVSAVTACLNNVGPGFDMVGPAKSFAEFSDFSKFILTVDMLLGRLELYPILVIFSPAIWSKNKGCQLSK